MSPNKVDAAFGQLINVLDKAACEYGAANTSPSIVLRQPESALIRALSKVSALKGEVRAAFLEASGVISKHYLDGSHDAYVEELKELGNRSKHTSRTTCRLTNQNPKFRSVGRAIAAFLRTRLLTVVNRLRRATEIRGEAVAGRPTGRSGKSPFGQRVCFVRHCP